MAQQESISKVVEQSAFKQLEDLKKGLTDAGNELSNFQKKAAGIELKLGGVSSFMELKTLMAELGQAQAGIAKSFKDLTTVSQDNTKAKVESIKVQREELKLKKDIDKALAREQKAIDALSNDYKILSKAQQEAANRANNYALQLGALHPITVQAFKDSQNMNSALKALDATNGVYSRNVGNYNGVAAQFNQLLRELPNLAISPRTFIMALSNNISYFGESIASSVKQGAGFKDILKSMFTGSNALVAGLNLAAFALVAFGDKLFGAGEEAEDTSKKIDSVTESIDKLIKKEVEYGRSIQNLTNQGANAAKRSLDLSKAMGDSDDEVYKKEQIYLNKTSDALKEEEKIYLSLINAANGYASAKDRAKQGSPADPSFFDDLNELVSSLPSNQRLEFVATLEKNFKDGTLPLLAEGLSNEYDKIHEKTKDAINETTLSTERFKKDQADKEKKEAERQAKEAEKRAKEEEERIKKELDALTKAQIARINMSAEANKAIISDDSSTYDQQRAARIQLSLDEQAIIEAELRRALQNNDLTETEKLAITLESNLKMMQARNQLTNDLQAIDQKEKDNFDKKEKDRVKAATDADKAIHDRRVAYFDARKKEHDEEVARNKQIAESINQIANAVLSLGQIRSHQTTERLRQLGVEIERTQENYQYEVDAIQNSAKTAEEKERAVRDAQATTQAKTSELRRKEIEERRRQAAFDKAMAITQIIINTAAAVAVALLDPKAPLIKAAAVGIAGAAQLAVAAAAPLPAYKGGTEDHIGGKFIAGDGGEKELVLTPDGKAFMTGDTPGVYEAPKHSKVLNQDMINDLFLGLNAATMAKVLNSKPQEKDISKDLAVIMDRNTNRTIKAIKQNRAIQSVNVTGNDGYYLSKLRKRA